MMKRGWMCMICLCCLFSCSQKEKDKGIRQMITAQAKEEIAFAAVDYSVLNGVVTLRGTCATEKERNEVESEMKQTSGVTNVVNQITVAPVVLTGAHLLKKAIDSVLMNYPAVQVTLADSVVYLNGEIDKESGEKLRQELTGLKVKMVDRLAITVQ